MRDVAADADLETPYGASRFAAAREGRRATDPLLRDGRGLSVVTEDVAGLLTVTGELTGSRDPAFVDREPGAPAISSAMGVNRPGASFHEESARAPVPDRPREKFPDRHARSTISCPASHRDRMSLGPGTVLRMCRDGTKATRCRQAVQLTGGAPRARARCDDRRST